jgi:NAD(P)-dependent dehydrogenase (short-subunit alcohol dehydrogenase family)
MTRAETTRATALITGAAKRIGRAIACALADNGMNVVVHYNRSRNDALELVALIRKKGVLSWAIAADFERGGGEDLIKRAAIACGKSLSVLVNNASIYPKSSLKDMTHDDLARCIRVNAWAPLCLSRAFASHTGHRRGRGCIVNMLDNRISGRDSAHTAYLLSKQMLASITRLCAWEMAPSVRVNGVAPGLVLPPAGKGRAYLDKLKKGVPLRAHGTPLDIAAAVVFCVNSPILTGEIITLDGGRRRLP